MRIAAILMGGYSGENEISLKSGQFIFDNINKDIFLPIKVIVNTKKWFAEWDGKEYAIDKNNFSFIVEGIPKKIDVVYNTIHGTPGEDGLIQAYFDLVGTPYTGCGHYISALTFNKVDCNLKVAKLGHLVPESIRFIENEKNTISFENISNKIGVPFMVKASRSGSSIGVNKVNKKEDLAAALENSFAVDNQILVEQFILGTEVSVGVYRNTSGEVVVLELTEIISTHDFFDYDAKYSGKTKEITPANVSESITYGVKEQCALIYDQLELKGIVRIDFIIKEEKAYFIEVNTNPGMSPTSIFPQQAKYADINLLDLFTSQLEMALNENK